MNRITSSISLCLNTFIEKTRRICMIDKRKNLLTRKLPTYVCLLPLLASAGENLSERYIYRIVPYRHLNTFRIILPVAIKLVFYANS